MLDDRNSSTDAPRESGTHHNLAEKILCRNGTCQVVHAETVKLPGIPCLLFATAIGDDGPHDTRTEYFPIEKRNQRRREQKQMLNK